LSLKRRALRVVVAAAWAEELLRRGEESAIVDIETSSSKGKWSSPFLRTLVCCKYVSKQRSPRRSRVRARR